MTTPEQIADLERETSPHALITFVELTHPALPGGALRYVADVLPYVWRGQAWQEIGGIELPQADDGEDEPRVSFTVPNIERRIGQTIETITSPIRVALHVLSSADFDLSATPRTEIGTAVSAYSMSEFETVDASFDDIAAEVSLILRDYAQEPFGLYATPEIIPGAYR